MQKKIYFVANGAASATMSGGIKYFIEIAKRFSRDGYNVSVITNPVGEKLFKKNGLTNVNYILTESRYKEITNPIKIFTAYITRAFKTKKVIKNIIKKYPKENRVFIFSSEIYCSTLSFINLKKEKKVLIFNMVAPNPFMGYSQKFHIPNFSEIHYFLTNIIIFILLKLFANKKMIEIIAVAGNIKQDLLNRPVVRNYDIKVINLGVDELPKNIMNQDKIYDFAWIGRNHPQKGIDDLEKMLLEFKKIKKDFTILIIGNVKDRLERYTKENGLEKNLILKGVINGNRKYDELAKAKIFLFTSHFESFGIVVIENMKVGNVVIGYDIPTNIYNFPKNMIFVPKFNQENFAREALNALDQYPDRSLIEKNYEFIKDFSWENTYKAHRALIHNDN